MSIEIIPSKVLRGPTAPSNQLTRALIGFGVIGDSENHLLYKGSRLVGLCDPFRARVRRGLRRAQEVGWGKIRAYRDFLELLDDPGVDIVHVCSPTHWHGVQCVMAAKSGKDIWNEKPMTRTLGESVRVMESVSAHKRIFRLNTWFRFQNDFYGFGTPVKPLKQMFLAGLFGTGPCRCTVGKGQGLNFYIGWSGLTNPSRDRIPRGFDYEMWLGPAPWRPYSHHRVGSSCRGYWDYEGGGLGDMSQHYLDPLQYVLGKDEESPVKVEYVGPPQHPEAVGGFDRITLTYADGTELVLDGNDSLSDEPLICGANGLGVYPKLPDGKTFRVRDANGWWSEEKVLKLLSELPEPPAQNVDFEACCRSRERFALNELNGFRSAVLRHLAVTAQRLGRGFAFDPVSMRAVGDEAANRFLYEPLRSPWAAALEEGGR